MFVPQKVNTELKSILESHKLIRSGKALAKETLKMVFIQLLQIVLELTFHLSAKKGIL